MPDSNATTGSSPVIGEVTMVAAPKPTTGPPRRPDECSYTHGCRRCETYRSLARRKIDSSVSGPNVIAWIRVSVGWSESQPGSPAC